MKLKHRAVAASLLLVMTSAASVMAGPTADGMRFADRGQAEEMIVDLPLHPVEGIWEYPADEVALMVLRDTDRKGLFKIYYVEGTDCRLYPGQSVGEIEETAERSKFKISLCSRISDGLPGHSQTGVATLSEQDDRLIIEMPRLKLKFSPSVIFPTLWNKLRLNMRIHTSDPLDKLPEGWIKTFPSADSATPSKIRYL